MIMMIIVVIIIIIIIIILCYFLWSKLKFGTHVVSMKLICKMY
jgi:hypothetical protein